jgi:hypothetical protein
MLKRLLTGFSKAGDEVLHDKATDLAGVRGSDESQSAPPHIYSVEGRF